MLTFYPGANPNVMATTVTAPLERQFGQLQGLSQMTSTSSGGTSVIVLQFSLALNIDVAEEEVQSAINASQSYLPSNLPTPPVYSKTNPADAPVLTLAITSDSMPLSQVEDDVDTRLAPKISQLSGVGLVSISGGQKPAVRIQANPTALSSYGLGLEDLRTALVQASVNSAKGNFDGPHQDYQINANDQLVTSADYKRHCGRVPQRCPGDAERRCLGSGRHRKQQPCGLDGPAIGLAARRTGPHPGRDPEYSAATRRQHHCRGEKHQGHPAAAGDGAPCDHQSNRNSPISPPPFRRRSTTLSSNSCSPSRWWSW